MVKKLGVFTVAIAVLAMTGCAGRNFTRLSDEQLMLGQDSKEQVIEKLGKPYMQGAITKNDKLMKTMTYAYASAGGEPAVQGVTPARSQAFYFFENTLVGHEYVSSFSADSTNFDEAKINNIKKGETNIEEAMKIMGSPQGEYIYPLVDSEDERAKVYVYGQTSGTAFNLKQFQKVLSLTFDKAGVVTKVDYIEDGSL